MIIADERVQEFIKIYAEEFGDELSTTEAREVALNLCELYLILLSPTPSEQKAMEERSSQEVTLMPPSSPTPDIHPPAP